MKAYQVPLTIIRLLADGQFHSGEQIGERLGMSRAAVNQHIRTIQSWGLDIHRITGKGYAFSTPIQLLDAKKMQHFAPLEDIDVIPIIDSTNQYLLDRIGEISSGKVCISEYQTAGRGRRGRKWFSSFGTNLYYSMYWKLEQGPAAAMGVSLVVGIVMAEVLHEIGAKDVRVKWPNDLYMNDSKLAGILVELVGKTGDTAHIVIGIGINLMLTNVDTNLVQQQWASLQQSNVDIDRNQLAAKVTVRLRQAMLQFEEEGLAPFINRWAPLDNFLNRPVKLIIGDKEILGIARGIDQHGALLLEQEEGIKSWIGGEISLRGL